MSFRVVIPARYASSRLPGKPLRPLAGRPMITHVWDNALASGAELVRVATDDERIAQAVRAHGGHATMTASHHRSGTDRIAEVATDWPDDTIVVNLQGDEPGVGADLVRLVADALAATPEAGLATVATPIRRRRELFDPNAVKVVCDDRGLALYFSRAPIPYDRARFRLGEPVEDAPLEPGFLRHIGLYAYRVGTLRRLTAAPENGHERAEALEQLRALALGVRIHVSVIPEAPLHGVDTEEDLRRVQARLGDEAGAP